MIMQLLVMWRNQFTKISSHSFKSGVEKVLLHLNMFF